MTDKQKIFIPNYDARESLAQKLNLEYHVGMQDWEYEISDYKRLNDFLREYDKSETSDSEKMSLMEIILDCLDDLLNDKKQNEFDLYFDLAMKRIKESKDLHSGTLNYWSKNDFEISREITKSGYNKA